MKITLLSLTLLLGLLSVSGCKQKPSSESTSSASPQANDSGQPKSVSNKPPFEGGRKTSFQEVTSQLDPGGTLFLYLATDQWLANLSKKVSDFRQIILSLPGPGMENRDEIERGFDLLSRLIKNSGVEDVSGVGASGAPVAPDLFRNKMILHHNKGAGQGFLWSMFGKVPHTLGGQDMLPTNTVLASFGDLDLTQLWQVLERELAQSGIPEAAAMARSFPQMFEQQTQVPWAKLLNSLGGEMGLVLTLDESRRITIPSGQGQMRIPTPGLLLAVKVNNDLVFDRISNLMKENPSTVVSQEPGLKLCSMPLPLPIPIPLQPTVASSGDYLFFASSPEMIRNVQAVRKGKQPGVKASEDFQELAKYLPAQGNQFVYVSKSFGKTVSDIQKQALRESGLEAEKLAVFQRLFGSGSPGYSLAVGAHTATGWQTTSVGNQEASAALLVAPVAVTAVAAGLALPAVAKAKSRAQSVSSVSQMKQLGLAARMYANDHQEKLPTAQTWCDDIKAEVGSPKVFKSPNDSGPGLSSYAFNKRLSGMDLGKVSPQTVLFFEADGTWNQSGGPELLLPQPRSGNSYVIGFVDGSVQQIQASRIRSLRWDP